MAIARSSVLLLAAGVLCSCHPKPIGGDAGLGYARRPLVVGASLDCPEEAGALIRTARSADGRSCDYDGPHQEKVALSYLALGGATAGARLASLDRSLDAELPSAVATGPGAAGMGGPAVDVAAGGTGRDAHIDLPGFHLNASGDRASIHMPGVSINADGGDARVTTGPQGHEATVVSAHPGGSEVRVGGLNANGADMTYILAADQPGPTGYRVVGYMAKGPPAGPLVVGVFRVREHEHGHNEMSDLGVSRLIDLNVHAKG